jgi:hypothetical protein
MKINLNIIFVFALILIFFHNIKDVKGQILNTTITEKECDTLVRENVFIIDSFFVGDKVEFVFSGNCKWFMRIYNALTFCFKGKTSFLYDANLNDSITMIVEINVDFDTIICEPKNDTFFSLTVISKPQGVIRIPELGKKLKNQIKDILNIECYDLTLINGNSFSIYFKNEENAYKVRELLYEFKKKFQY